MGTPEYTVKEALRLFKEIGADGAEIVVQDGYQSGIPTGASDEVLKDIKACADENGIEIIALTPYNSHFNSLNEEERISELRAIEEVIHYCEVLGAKCIRIYGGNVSQGETDRLDEKRAKLVESMKYLGEKAMAAGVTLVVENHFNTMTLTARQSADLIRDVNCPGVRILYDQANLTFTGNEPYEEAVEIQSGLIGHMHVKDLKFHEGNTEFKSSDVSHPDESERNVYTRIVGEGVVPWKEILQDVKDHGYTGWLSLEYERRWHPDDIPDASIGMKKSIQYLREECFPLLK
ncbi:MAG: sugar phosphate isomerase/epimerase [Blautia sp.]|nr:sugar phosphate isomerase/epimerase [Blautia sp.]